MNIEERIEQLKNLRLYCLSIGYEFDEDAEAIEWILTAYEKEKETSHYIQSQLDIANAKLVEEKEKNKELRERLAGFCNVKEE